jgi:hypothetical protein
MYAKVTTYQLDTSRLSEVNNFLSEIKGKCNTLPGILFYNTVWREDGHGVSTTIYDCRASADEASVLLQGIWSQFSGILTGPPVTNNFNRTKDMLAK